MDTNQAWRSIFGYVLLNDISLRDVQNWEYVPLGPFTSKNLLTVISPWVVSPEALAPLRVSLPEQNPRPFQYLSDENHHSYDLELSVAIKSKLMSEYKEISVSNFRHLYWSPAQQMAHHTVTGCNLRTGDLIGSGTISGPDENSQGSLLELSWNGTKSIPISNSEKRTFWEDFDEIKISSKINNLGVGFGDCLVQLLPN